MMRVCSVLLLFICLTSCATAPAATLMPTATLPHTATLTPETPTLLPVPTLTPTPVPTITTTPTPVPTPTPLASVQVIAYNILYGAGIDRQYDAGVLPNLVGKNRLPDLVSFIRSANPDIWSIEEATGWDKGSPPAIQQVAEQLGMNYYLAQVPSGFHVGLLTKFRILETENLTADVGRQGALRALLQSPDGKKWNVFAVHLDPAFADTRACEVSALLQKMRPYAGQLTILMGDMNFKPTSQEYRILISAGWQPVAIEPNWRIDQLWLAPAVRGITVPWFEPPSAPQEISDHSPIGARLNIYPGTILPAVTPKATKPPDAIPSYITDVVTGIQVSPDGFDDPCAVSKWTSRWITERFSGGVLEITGEEPWQAGASRYKEFTAGQAVLVRFRSIRGSEFEIRLDNSAWNTPLYQRLGLNVLNNRPKAIVWQGASSGRGQDLSDNLELVPDALYTLLLGITKDGEFVAQMWDPSDTTRVIRYRERLDNSSPGLPWIFGISVNKGKVSIDHFTELSFSAVK